MAKLTYAELKARLARVEEDRDALRLAIEMIRAHVESNAMNCKVCARADYIVTRALLVVNSKD